MKPKQYRDDRGPDWEGTPMFHGVGSSTVCSSMVEKSFSFAEKFIGAGKSGKDFGSNIVRGDQVRTVDSALGMVGELGFSQIMSSFDIYTEVDEGVRVGGNEGDWGQDINRVWVDGEKRILIPKMDIKTTKKGSGWLLVERHRLQASIFVVVLADVPRKKEDMGGSEIKCEFGGYCFYSDFLDGSNAPHFRFKKGDRLLSPSYAIDRMSGVDSSANKYMNVTLKCPDQCGLPIKLLRQDIEGLARIIKTMSIPEDRRLR